MKLTLVGLPLGNIGDISLRAIDTLKQAQLVICEDTRVFYRLWSKLQNLGHLPGPYTGRLAVVNDFNEKSRWQAVLDQLNQAGEGILVSDAGLPGISDPGFVLINKVLEQGGGVDIVPGSTAAFSALSISGFSSDRVLYLGFLPQKTAKRSKIFTQISSLCEGGLTVIIYESPRRVAKTLAEIQTKLGNLPCVIARELTKEHQQILRGAVSTLLAQLATKPAKGEITLLLRA